MAEAQADPAARGDIAGRGGGAPGRDQQSAAVLDERQRHEERFARAARRGDPDVLVLLQAREDVLLALLAAPGRLMDRHGRTVRAVSVPSPRASGPFRGCGGPRTGAARFMRADLGVRAVRGR
ncbi:hypothetical protein GCM10023237_46280 [Streptomyces coeruleoprunus]